MFGLVRFLLFLSSLTEYNGLSNSPIVAVGSFSLEKIFRGKLAITSFLYEFKVSQGFSWLELHKKNITLNNPRFLSLLWVERTRKVDSTIWIFINWNY